MVFLMFLVVSQPLFANPAVKGFQTTTANFILIIAIFLIGILMGGISIYLYSKWKVYSILSIEKRSYLDSLKGSKERYLFKYIGIIGELKKSKDEKKIDNNDLIIKNGELKKELNKLKIVYEKTEDISKNKNSTWGNNDLDTISKPIDLNIEPVKGSEPEIYFEIPEEDGTFKIQDGKSNQNTYSFYKIVTDKDPLKAEIYFISGSLDLRALGNIDNYLNPVCEIENIVDRMQAKRIKMISPGTVFLNGESWKIDVNNKVKIRLI